MEVLIMKERLMPILSLVVLFALVGSMAYFGQAGQQEVKESEVIATTSVEKVEQEVVESDDFLERVEERFLENCRFNRCKIN